MGTFTPLRTNVASVRIAINLHSSAQVDTKHEGDSKVDEEATQKAQRIDIAIEGHVNFVRDLYG